jgi:ligand-binding sensor domain-containing protein
LHRIFSYIFLFLLWGWYTSGYSQQFDFRNYSVSDGLAQSQVFSMIEDRRGLIWVGTRGGGISRFDGKEFQTITTREGLINNYVLSLAEDHKGRIWIGTDNGLSCFNGQQLQGFLKNDTIPTSVYSIHQASDGIIWLATNAGIYQIINDSLINFSKNEEYFPPQPNEIIEDNQGRIWIAHNKGIVKIEEGQRTTYATRSGLRDLLINAVAKDTAGTIWVASYKGQISRWNGRRFERVLTKEDLNDALVFDIQFDDEGLLWIATQNQGVVIWNPEDSTTVFLDEKVGLSNNHVRTILQDSWGNMWFGSSGGGVSKYYGQQFVHYDQNSGLKGNRIYALWEDSDCRIWMGVAGKGIAVYDQNQFTYFDSKNGFKDIKVKSLFQDRKGRIWIGTEGQGVSLYADSTFTDYDTQNGLSGNWIRDITDDKEGNIWIATAGGGLTRIIEKVDTIDADIDSTVSHFRFSTFNQRSGLSEGRINDLHVDKWGRLWYATDNSGIGYIQNDSVKANLTLQGGLQNNSVRSIAEDPYGYLWVGTAGGGVSKAFIYQDTSQYDFINHKERLTSANIYLLAFDDIGNLWIGTEKGMDKATLDVDRNIIDVKHFGQSEGFVGIETTQNAVIKDREGNLWIGTMNGLTNYNPRTNISNPKPPILNITQVRLFYELLEDYPQYKDWVGDWGQLKPGLQLPYNLNHLGFEFQGIDHDNPDQVRYQWRLKGSETDWSPVSKKTDVTYSNLPAGEYTFEVRACNEDGVWNEVPARVSFSILPPIWDLRWFRAAVIGGLILIILIIAARWVSQVKRKAREEKERLEMEKGLLELEQKALRLQMNPHFIFNALNSIQGIITLRDAKTARYYLAKFSKLMRLVLENSREPLITLAGEIQTLDNYLSLEQFSRGDSFDYTIELGDDIDDEEYLIPPMILQPFIENAIIHGVAHLDHKGKIHVKFTRTDSHLECTITDNGVGRKKAAEIKSQREHHHKSTALIVTQERLNILNPGEAQSIDIQDLVAANGEAAGTRVVVRIPIKENTY